MGCGCKKKNQPVQPTPVTINLSNVQPNQVQQINLTEEQQNVVNQIVDKIDQINNQEQ